MANDLMVVPQQAEITLVPEIELHRERIFRRIDIFMDHVEGHRLPMTKRVPRSEIFPEGLLTAIVTPAASRTGQGRDHYYDFSVVPSEVPQLLATYHSLGGTRATTVFNVEDHADPRLWIARGKGNFCEYWIKQLEQHGRKPLHFDERVRAVRKMLNARFVSLYKAQPV